MHDPELKQQIRQARGKFIAMAGCYCLGVFNDSFYRQAAMLLAVSMQRPEIQGWVMLLFTLPYLLVAAPAGWLADRFSKGRVVIAAKGLEIVAMLCGAVGILTGNWALTLVMAFTMGLQSCLFSPALNGSIPELYPAVYVPTANAILKIIVTGAILGGGVSSSIALSFKHELTPALTSGRLIVGIGVILISALGFVISLGVPKHPPAAPEKPFPWTGPLATLKQLVLITKDRLLTTIVLADAFVWFIGALVWPLVNVMAVKQLTETGAISPDRCEMIAGVMLACQLIGVALGGVIGGWVGARPRWYMIVPAASFIMGIPAILITRVPLLPVTAQLPVLLVLLGILGIAGGSFMIPCEAFIQIRPLPQNKGAVISSSNFVIFSAIIMAGLFANWLNVSFAASTSFGILGCMSLAAAVIIFTVLRNLPEDTSEPVATL